MMLPLNVMWDRGVSQEDANSILEACVVFQRMFPGRKIRIVGNNKMYDWEEYSSADWFIMNGNLVNNPESLQLDSISLLELIQNNPYLRRDPRIDVLFTSIDLGGGISWCFGRTSINGHCTVQSTARYQGLAPADKNLAIKAVMFHELGHVFGMAADPRRSNTEENFGNHCTNPGCIMRQGVNIGQWLDNAHAARRYGRIYCPQCLTDAKRITL